MRKVCYTFRSKDQGWSSYPAHHGTYNDSWTFFEAGLTRYEAKGAEGAELRRQQTLRTDKEKHRWVLQRNRHAGRVPEDYDIELGECHELLQTIENGDRFALWARAMYPGWENEVHGARIEIWCVDDLADD